MKKILNKMELIAALLIYIVILIIITLIIYWILNTTLISAFIVALLIALIFLLYLYGPMKLQRKNINLIFLYLIIASISIIAIIIYVLCKAVNDNRDKQCYNKSF